VLFCLIRHDPENPKFEITDAELCDLEDNDSENWGKQGSSKSSNGSQQGSSSGNDDDNSSHDENINNLTKSSGVSSCGSIGCGVVVQRADPGTNLEKGDRCVN
jgi:hypothetical protein